MAESGGTIKWIETIRSPTTQEWSLGGFASLERVDATGMFDGHVRESRESAAISGIGAKVCKNVSMGNAVSDFRLSVGDSFFFGSELTFSRIKEFIEKYFKE